MDIELLGEIGLTEGEIKVYLALLKLGATKTGQLASVANVSSSKVYKILDRLEGKGLVGHVLKGEIKYFTALPPRRIMDYVEEKEKQLEERKIKIEKLLPELEKQQKNGEESEASIYGGFKGVTNFFKSMIDEMKPGETYYVIGAGYGEPNEQLRRFFHKHHQKRTAKGIKLKMLANYEVKNNIESTTRINSQIRYLPQYLSTNMEIVFYKRKAFIAIWAKEPTGFLLENEEAVKGFEKYFNALWKIAKK